MNFGSPRVGRLATAVCGPLTSTRASLARTSAPDMEVDVQVAGDRRKKTKDSKQKEKEAKTLEQDAADDLAFLAALDKLSVEGQGAAEAAPDVCTVDSRAGGTGQVSPEGGRHH